MLNINYFLIGLISYLVADSNAVSFVKPCKADDKACMTASAQAVLPFLVPGIPERGIPAVDPILIDSVRSDESNLKLGFKDITLTGISKCKILELERNAGKNTMKMVVECPLHGVGQYDLNGKIGPIVAYGEGEFQIHTKNARITIEVRIKDIVKEGKKHWKVTGFDYSYDLLEKVHIDLKNLFDGDEERAKPLKQIFDTSSNELVREIGGPLIRQLLSKILKVVDSFFLSFPSEELEIPSS